MSLAEVTQVNSIHYSISRKTGVLKRCMRFPVSKFPGQLVHSLPTKLRVLLEGMAVAVSRGKYMDEFVGSGTYCVLV